MEFHQIQVKSLKKLTPVSIEIDFEIPKELKSNFTFKPGQYVTIDHNGNRRDYSLCTSPLDDRWSVGIKVAKNGLVSGFLNNELKVGDFLKVSTPNGRFGIPTKPNEKRTILAFAAGSGITPIMSVLKYTLQTEKWVNFYLFYSNKTPQDTMFLAELDHLKKQYPDNFHPHLFYTQHKLEDWLFEGRLDSQKFKLILNQLVDINEVDEALVCGPSEMIEIITADILKAGIQQENIHYELFKTTNTQEIVNTETEIDQVEVTVELDGEVSTMIWDTKKNLVDALQDEGIDAPYSCKGGICSSCMCRLEKGEVTVKENHVLTDSDREEGLILACCSRPVSKEIRINFDDI